MVQIACIDGISGSSIGRRIQNQSTVAKLDKSKNSILRKKYAKVRPTKTDFLTFGAKQAFLQL